MTQAPEGMSTKKKQILAMKDAPYSLINGFLYKIGLDEVLHRCVLEHERESIMHEAHYGRAGGNFHSDTTAKKIQQSRLCGQDYTRIVKCLLVNVIVVNV